MYIMYVDESGDLGISRNSPTRYYCLSGLVIHESKWIETTGAIVEFRRKLKRTFGVYLENEVHCGAMINNVKKCDPPVQRLKKYQRLSIIRHTANFMSGLSDRIRVINVVVDKYRKTYVSTDSVFEKAWYALIQRFENTIIQGNFPGSTHGNDFGLIYSDSSNDKKLHECANKIRKSNPLYLRQRSGNYQVIDHPITRIIEEPVSRDSKYSYYIQMADCMSFLLKQYIEPSAYTQKNGAHSYFKRTIPILCTQASQSNDFGIVFL